MREIEFFPMMLIGGTGALYIQSVIYDYQFSARLLSNESISQTYEKLALTPKKKKKQKVIYMFTKMLKEIDPESGVIFIDLINITESH